MSTRHLVNDAGHCLRAAAPPLLALSVLAVAGTTQGEVPPAGGVAELVCVGWRAAVLGTLLWFLVAVVWAATRPLRDRRAFQRLQHLRDIAGVPDRALVYVQTIVWSSAAGQDVVVVNVTNGGTSHVWLPETSVPIGSFAVLELNGHGVQVVQWMNANQVNAAHRHERRHPAQHNSGAELGEVRPEPESGDDARQLIMETERFLKEHETRW